MKRIVPLAVATLAVAALAGVVALPERASAVEPNDNDRTVSVTGTGTVSVIPDRAELSFGVESRGATAKGALAANAVEMRKLIAALRSAGAAGIATQWVGVNPVLRDGVTIEEWSATNTVSASIEAAKAGALIDTAVGAGANQVYGPSLSSSDAKKLQQDALQAAVADARARAEALAKAAGGTLGAVVTLSEGGGGGVLPYAEKAAMDSGTPIVAGPQDVTATVSVTYELR